MSDSDDEVEFESNLMETCEVDVLLLDGTCRENYPITLARRVREEKENIWKSQGQGVNFNVNDVVLVLVVGPNKEEKLMDDDEMVDHYLHDFAVSSIKFVRRSDFKGQ